MASPVTTQDKTLLASLYETIYTIRVFESEGIKLYRKGLIRGYFHPYTGEEAIAVGVCAALREQDYITSTHRGHGHCIARGADIRKMTAELLGRATGYCRGRGGSMHIADMSAGNLGANGVVGAGTPLGVGAALGTSIRGEDRVTACFTSDGAVMNGTFGEALNLAAAWSLPFVLVVENNQYAVSTPVEQTTRELDLYKRGQGMGVHSVGIDGNDVVTVYDTMQDAIGRCQAGEGPVMIECRTFRHGGHHVNDPGLYLPQDKLQHYLEHDPLTVARQYLMDAGATEAEVADIDARVEASNEDAIAFAIDSPEPDLAEFLEEVEANE
ncbi:MAG: thiamine pyrophosphate-dependent dehydrogenase E1 component subunit alpha [Lentisphaeria bacterium]|jgi:pyruvate dehydrogenase E1 component alpha subunit|nr:thiamine pyrophosphate-dependent dehydrogenase E1 component subunit alpha [Lentisphaeria bacterium]MDP7740544.1 thiamine pyrophosphate-dependent dehydrogenase E1 component subunit alpha [Lentisphaeria bacterium]